MVIPKLNFSLIRPHSQRTTLAQARSDENLHKLLRFLAANSAHMFLLLLVALIAGDEVAALVHIADAAAVAELALERSRYLGAKAHLLFEVVELALADPFPFGFGPQPDVLEGAVDEQVAERDHSEANGDLPEGHPVNFVVPEGGHLLEGVASVPHGLEDELRLEDELLL
jgi:hypothetical protein